MRAALSAICLAVAPAAPNERITRSRCFWLGVTGRCDRSLTAPSSRGTRRAAGRSQKGMSSSEAVVVDAAGGSKSPVSLGVGMAERTALVFPDPLPLDWSRVPRN